MYEVSIAPRVLDAVRRMLQRNPARGAELVAALSKLERQLQIYPQFGQPLWDLSVPPAQLWIGVVAPLVLHYVLDESRRRVTVVRELMVLPRTGIV